MVAEHMSGESSTTIVQARVSRSVAAAALQDATELGLEGTSGAIRAGLSLLHAEAELSRALREIDEFYGGQMAPASEVIAAMYSDES
jgi:hypothetical protein